jgi:hypothetical protein
MYFKKNQDLIFPLLLLGIWIVAIFLVHPTGEFPLNDDWAYAKVVETFAKQGHWEIHPWGVMTLIGHILWALPFVKTFGYSFLVLRSSILVLGFVGIACNYWIFRHFQLTPLLSFLTALLVTFNPIYFSLSYTFMTDISSYAFSSLAILFFLREFENRKRSNYLLAIVFSAFAVLIRQPGILYPFAFGFVSFFTPKEKKNMLYSLAPFLLVLFTYCFYDMYLKYLMDPTMRHSNKSAAFVVDIMSDLGSVLIELGFHFAKTGLYIGLFLLPLSFVVLPRSQTFQKNKILFFSTLVTLSSILVLLLYWKGKEMPFGVGNVLTNAGVGAELLYKTTNPLDFPLYVWRVAEFISFLSISILCVFVFEQVVKAKKEGVLFKNKAFWFSLFCTGFHGLIMFPFYYYDRYSLPVELLFLLCLFSFRVEFKFSWTIKIVSFLMVLFYAAYSILGTSTYFNWNRARWEAYRYLVAEKGVSIKRIDAGAEVNGTFNYDPDFILTSGTEKSFWWVDEVDYVITFGKAKGYVVEKSFPFRNDLRGKQGAISVCKKIVTE